MMILLTPEEAEEVKGYTSSMTGLNPRVLKDGNYVLPVEVLDDPAHSEHHDLLVTLPLIEDPEFPDVELPEIG